MSARFFIIAGLFCVCLVVAPSLAAAKIAASGNEKISATQDAAIIVAGRRLAGLNSTAQRRGGRIFLPIVAIARAFGDSIIVDAAFRRVEVRRQNGASAEFDARVGQIKENGAVVLIFSNTAEIAFPPNIEALMLPSEIVAALLGAAIRFETTADGAIIVARSAEAPNPPTKMGARRGAAEIERVDYEYNLNRYNSFAAHNLTVSGQGRIGDGRFNFFSNFSRTARQPGMFRGGALTYERPNGQRIAAGDFGTGAVLPLMSATVRGASAQIPIGKLRVTAFAGRSVSGAFFPLVPNETLEPTQIETSAANRVSQRDTSVVGVYATRDFSGRKTNRASGFVISAGAMRFNSPNRRGEMLSGNFRYDSARIRLQADAAIGNFSGVRQSAARVSGFAAALDVSGTFQLLSNLTLQGRYNQTGTKFFSPQIGFNEPIRQIASGASWQPKKWLTAAVSASTSSRTDDKSQRYRAATASVNLTPRGNSLPTVFISHTESRTPQLGAAALTIINAGKNFSRWRLFFDATRVKILGAATHNGQIGANFRVNETNSIEAVQSLGSGGSFGGMVNWNSSNLFDNRLSFSAGLGYNRNRNAELTTLQRFSGNLRISHQNALQINVFRANNDLTLLVGWRGSLWQPRKNKNVFNAPLAEMNSFGSFSGRVYQDANLDGQFDPAVDRPQPFVIVRVNGSRYVRTNSQGIFKIDDIKSGEYEIYLDLMSVRADLTILDAARRRATLVAGRETIVDFRLVRTGRISGVVWLDADGNGKFDSGEQPLADVRVVAASGQDTLTDANGAYTIGDLAPGEYTVLIDEKTLPEKTKPARTPLSIKVLAGAETGDNDFAIVALPAEVKRFVAKSKE